MRGLKSTLALLAVLIGLGAYIYFGGAKKPSDTPASEKVFAGLDASKIDELTVKSESGDVTSLKKDGGAWKMTAPMAVPAAETDASAIANAMGDMEITRVVDDNPADVKDYGLDTPRMTIDFKSADGKTSGKLLVGAKTATGSGLYARKNDDKRVLLVPQYQETTLNKSTFDLRDKAIMKFDRAKVDGFDVNVGSNAFELARVEAEWKLTKPAAARADSSAAEGLLSKVESAQMKAVASAAPTPEDLKKFGLDKPQATINLHMGSARATLLVGAKADDMTVYVRDTSKPDVFTVDTATADDLKKAADDYRRKEFFDFRAFNATHVELTHNGQTVVFDRVKAKDDKSPDTWHRASPNPGDPDREKVERLLAGLADIRATSFVDKNAKTGLNAPALTVLTKFEDGKKEERVILAKNGTDAFASRADDPTPGKIEAEKLDEALKSLDELAK